MHTISLDCESSRLTRIFDVASVASWEPPHAENRRRGGWRGRGVFQYLLRLHVPVPTEGPPAVFFDALIVADAVAERPPQFPRHPAHAPPLRRFVVPVDPHAVEAAEPSSSSSSSSIVDVVAVAAVVDVDNARRTTALIHPPLALRQLPLRPLPPLPLAVPADPAAPRPPVAVGAAAFAEAGGGIARVVFVVGATTSRDPGLDERQPALLPWHGDAIQVHGAINRPPSD